MDGYGLIDLCPNIISQTKTYIFVNLEIAYSCHCLAYYTNWRFQNKRLIIIEEIHFIGSNFLKNKNYNITFTILLGSPAILKNKFGFEVELDEGGGLHVREVVIDKVTRLS